MLALSLVSLLAGIVLLGGYFGYFLADAMGPTGLLTQALLGVVVMGHALIALAWFWNIHSKK